MDVKECVLGGILCDPRGKCVNSRQYAQWMGKDWMGGLRGYVDMNECALGGLLCGTNGKCLNLPGGWNQSPKGIIWSAVPLPCFFAVLKL